MGISGRIERLRSDKEQATATDTFLDWIEAYQDGINKGCFFIAMGDDGVLHALMAFDKKHWGPDDVDLLRGFLREVSDHFEDVMPLVWEDLEPMAPMV